MNATTGLSAAIAAAGSQASLAARLGVTQGAVGQWAAGIRPIPIKRCQQIEREFRVPCEDLRADVVWIRVADRNWKWHRRGRPVVDEFAAAAASA